jgi:PQQ-dependent dehydrogenase (methanol/ethanol family)
MRKRASFLRLLIVAFCTFGASFASVTGWQAQGANQSAEPASKKEGGASQLVGAAALDEKRLLAADKEPGSWLGVARTYSEQRFSPLSQINDRNVSNLGLAWYADIDTERGQEATPVIIDGVLYVTSAWSMVKAFDVRTGNKLWEFDPKVDKAKGADACCDVVNRGVAVWKGKIYVGALDGRLIALNGKTGEQIWSVQTTDTNLPYTVTGAPRIVKGKVIIGNGGAEYRVRGYVTAYDAETGKQAWRWYSVPGDPSKPFEQPELAMAAKTWNGEWWTIGGGGTPWDGIVYDPELDRLYVGTGNGDPWNQAIRSPGGGDNLFLASVVALDPNTGKYQCHFQETPGETWDYTSTQPLIIATLNYPTGKRKVILHAPKNGFFYVLDAKTCQPVAVGKYAPLTWATGWDSKTQRPIENPEARFDKTGKAVIVAPGALGMHNWHPMAYSPVTGYVYIPVQVSNAVYSGPKEFKLNLNGWNTGTDFSAGQDLYSQPGAPKRGNVESYILAWDPINMKEVWRIPNDIYGSSGIMVTNGNLLFSGNHNGEFVAYDATDGKKLWAAPAGARIVAAAATYNVDGQQQVAVLAGARGLPPKQIRTSAVSANNSRLLVFNAGGKATLPTSMPTGVAAPTTAKIDPPLLTASNETVAAGEQSFGLNCAACHGRNTVPAAGATAPDLRYSALIKSPEQFHRVVIDGERVSRGMPGFKTVLRDGEADSILAYIIKRANDEKAMQQIAK